MNKTVKLELDVNEINAVLAGLMELPKKIADQIYHKIYTTAHEQFNPPPVAEGDADKKADESGQPAAEPTA